MPLNIDHLLSVPETPAFVYDEAVVRQLLEYSGRLRSTADCRMLYSLKPLVIPDLLRLMAPCLDGFAVSSSFEARLASSALEGRGTVHFTTPGLRPDAIDAINRLCDYVSFNSLSQWKRYRDALSPDVSCGLRVNPQLSFLDDERYDPCRPDSKLGIPLEAAAALVGPDRPPLEGLDGLLVHSNCDSTDFSELAATVNRLRREIGGLLEEVKWVNLGGGYLFDDSANLKPLYQSIELLQSTYGLEVFIEPGAALVRSAGYIVSTALDIFTNGGKKIVILDTTINHMPEVFEYDFEPDLLGYDEEGEWEYLLAGCTCLAGDLFGEYRFRHPLKVGDKVIFNNAGAYTLPKAHTFNGVNLPTIYALNQAGRLELKRRFTYADYAAQWGVDVHQTV